MLFPKKYLVAISLIMNTSHGKGHPCAAGAKGENQELIRRTIFPAIEVLARDYGSIYEKYFSFFAPY